VIVDLEKGPKETENNFWYLIEKNETETADYFQYMKDRLQKAILSFMKLRNDS
jgi:hypothetical protein